MPGRIPDPSSSPVPEPPASAPFRLKARILMPVAISVAALAVFLIAFWPASHAGKQGHAQRDHASVRGSSPVGGSQGDELKSLGNTPVTKDGNSPVGGTEGSAPAGSHSNKYTGRDWDKGKNAANGGDQWWYQEKGAGTPDAGRDRERKTSKNSGPDEAWWHD